MRNFKKSVRSVTCPQRRVTIAFALTETAFSLELTRRTRLNRFDRDLGEQLWTTHEFAEAILPRARLL